MTTKTETHIVYLEKHPPQKYGVPDYFDRGERIIMVDGERWGRTRVQSHGSRGTTTTFEQDDGDGDRGTKIEIDGRPEKVRSIHRRHAKVYKPGEGYVDGPTWKPTEELVLEKAKELVAKGLLIHPTKRAQQIAERRARFERAQATAQERENERFQMKARETIGTVMEIGDPELHEKLVAAIVKAMRWAQDQ